MPQPPSSPQSPPPPAAPGGPGPGDGGPRKLPGLFGQIGATRGAAFRMVGAHIGLAKAELGEIWDHAKRALALGAAAIAVALYAALLLSIGSALFLGEWLFGSIGWGLAHGALFCLALIVTFALAAIEVRGSHLARAFLVGVGVAIVLGVLLGYSWAHDGWTRLGDSVLPGVEPGVRPLVTAVLASAIVLGLVGLLVGAAFGGGIGAGVGGLVLGAILGLILGALSAISFDPRAGVALGITAGLIVWPLLESLELRGFDWDALKAKYWPSATIDTTKETIEWVRARTPLGRKP